MTEILPFRAFRFPPTVGSLEEILAPPYDVITEAYRRTLLERHPANVVRALLKDPAAGDAGYGTMGETFSSWRANGTVVQDKEPAIYLLEQRYSWEGSPFVRTGILARFKVEPDGSRLIRPHEKTRGPAKEDRFAALKATRSNFSPIFMFFEDEGEFARAVAAAKDGHPILSTYTDDEGVEHTVWAITKPGDVEALARAAGRGPSYIADGHHRYATAQRYLHEVGPEGAATYGYFCPNDAGLLVLPYHRILFEAPSPAEIQARLEGRYLLKVAETLEAAARDVAHSTARFAFAICWPDGQAMVCESAQGLEDEFPEETPQCLKDLDYYFLHQLSFGHMGMADPRVEFAHSLAEARAELATHSNAVAILTRATPLRHIAAVADASESMPPKSTFFHPKIPSGILIHPLEGLTSPGRLKT